LNYVYGNRNMFLNMSCNELIWKNNLIAATPQLAVIIDIGIMSGNQNMYLNVMNEYD
jgi:hypothetical protein